MNLGRLPSLVNCTFALILALLAASPMSADTVTVTTTADSGAGSLREAIAKVSPGGTIEFSVAGTIMLKSTLVLKKGVTIQGPGADQLTISGRGTATLFTMNADSLVAFKHLTIAQAKGGFAKTPIYYGGIGHLTLENVTITHHDADSGGVFYSDSGSFDINRCTISNSNPEANSGASSHGKN